MNRRGRPKSADKRVPIQISVPAPLKERYLKLTEEQRKLPRTAMEGALKRVIEMLDTLEETC